MSKKSEKLFSSYREQLLHLAKLYGVVEVKGYARSSKKLTTSQLELLLIKNQIKLPINRSSDKAIAKHELKENSIRNVYLSFAFIFFIGCLITVRPYIKNIVNEVKFTYVAEEYKPLELAKEKNTKTKKDTFIKIVMPLILDENNKILENRKKLFKILGKSTNSMGEKRWLKRRFKEYGIKKGDITELKVRMDIIPTSIAIAQAAIESGWGTSRFALEGNAMFGQWTWSKNGIEPTDKSKNQNHKVLKFSMLRSSVKAYKNNLNTHNGYKEFREKRAELRKNNKKISGLKLVNYLHNYAATGKDYIKILKRAIDQNKLTDFDDATLMNSGKSLPARESLIL